MYPLQVYIVCVTLGWPCDVTISNAILWTHFVTPRGDQTQQDQTKQVSYYKKGESEESEHNSSCSGLV